MIFTLTAPAVLEFFTIITLSQVIGLAILALSLALVWGYGGILCFGQTAFFGLGAYAYAVAATNFGDEDGDENRPCRAAEIGGGDRVGVGAETEERRLAETQDAAVAPDQREA